MKLTQPYATATVLVIVSTLLLVSCSSGPSPIIDMTPVEHGLEFIGKCFVLICLLIGGFVVA